MGIAFVIFMGIFIKCCAVHTPSNNPKKPPARRLTDTLRQPMNTLRRMVKNKYKIIKKINVYLFYLLVFSVITIIIIHLSRDGAVHEVYPRLEVLQEVAEMLKAAVDVGRRVQLHPGILRDPEIRVAVRQIVPGHRAEANHQIIHRKVCNLVERKLQTIPNVKQAYFERPVQ